MTRTFTLPSRLYGIYDPTQSGGRHLDKVLKELITGGGRVVQLRFKELPAKEFLDLALEAKRETARVGCLLIINDRVDVALAAGADGVHLGQEDLPLAVARRLMGRKIIGISTHNLSQALEAQQGGADYIGFGPILGTRTKQTGYAPRGLDMLREVRRAVCLPIVAIGGLSEENVREVWQAGADAVAMISSLVGAKDISEATQRILALAQPSSASSVS